jgi:hypothetical protein
VRFLQSLYNFSSDLVLKRLQTSQTVAGQDEQDQHSKELSLPQDSALAAPRLETVHLPKLWRAKFIPNLLARLHLESLYRSTQRNYSTHGKVNCPTPKVNTFFGSLLITIFQKQDYLKHKTAPYAASDQDQ